MGIADKLQSNIQSWAVLAIVIVIVSIILTKFKTSNAGGITCGNSSALYYNASSNVCCLGTAATVTNCETGNFSAIGGVASTLDTFVSALAEPKNWLAIVLIALIGFAMLKLFGKKN